MVNEPKLRGGTTPSLDVLPAPWFPRRPEHGTDDEHVPHLPNFPGHRSETLLSGEAGVVAEDSGSVLDDLLANRQAAAEQFVVPLLLPVLERVLVKQVDVIGDLRLPEHLLVSLIRNDAEGNHE